MFDKLVVQTVFIVFVYNLIEFIEKLQLSATSTKWKISEIIHSSELRNKDRLTEKKLLKSKIAD